MAVTPCAPYTFQGNSSESEEDHSAGSMQGQAFPSTHRGPDAKLQPLHTKMEVIKKGHAKDSQRYKVDYESQSTDTQNFSSESKRETEYVSLPLPVGGGLSVKGPFPLWDLTGSPIPSPGPRCGDLTGPREPWLVLSWGGVAGPSMAAWDSLRPCTLRSNQSLPPQGPCRREVEDTLNRLKFLDMLSPRGIHIPNCDRKGFYKKKQVSGVLTSFPPLLPPSMPLP